MEKQSKLSIMLKGFIKENPVFVLVLGTCPTSPSPTRYPVRSAWVLRRQ